MDNKKPTKQEGPSTTNIEAFLAKVESFKEKNGADLSTAEDLSIAVMNLISLEEHFFFTAEKTKNDEYFDVIQEIRAERKKLLARLMPENEGETWCISKHLLSATMRLIEVGNKLQSDGDKAQAKETFASAYKMYSIFWALKAKLIKGRDIKGAASASVDTGSTLEDLVAKLADCCNE
jgi:hypothetical protein